MAAPAFQSFGTTLATLTNGTPGAPASVAQNDILLLIAEDGGSDTTTSLIAVTGGTETWTQLPVSPQASTGLSRLYVYWARASQASPTMPDVAIGNNHVVAAVGRFTGGTTSGNPYEGTEYAGGISTATTAIPIPGPTTGGVDRLIVAICSSGANLSSTTRFSNWANTNISPVERFDQLDTIGNGGGFGVATGVMASAGAVGDITVDEAFAGHGMISVALAPPQAVVGPPFRRSIPHNAMLSTDPWAMGGWS